MYDGFSGQCFRIVEINIVCFVVDIFDQVETIFHLH